MRHSTPTTPRPQPRYDCELPPDVRAELVGGRRQKPEHSISNVRRSPIKWRYIRGSLNLSAFALFLIALLAIALARYSHQPKAFSAPDLVLEHSKTLLAAQYSQPAAPIPSWSGAQTYGKAGVIGNSPRSFGAPLPVNWCTISRADVLVAQAPRARLVQLPAPRAQLVRPQKN